MSFEKINIPYCHTDEDKAILDEDYPATPSDWNKDKYSPIKKRIIDHLRTEQDHRCCYCKNRLGYDIKEVDIEHIIPKTTAVNFAFEPRNLALSCPACNTKKSTKNVLTKSVVRYPKNHQNFLIVHPHFSNYSDHIGIISNIIYYGKDQRGTYTIFVCELSRLGLARNNAMKVIEQSLNPLELDVEKIRTCKDEDLHDELLAKIHQAINSRKSP